MLIYTDSTAASAAAVVPGEGPQATTALTEDGKTMAQILAEAAAAVEPDRQTMTAAEYRQFILGQIAALPIDSSQSLASHAVHITDEGYAAMQSDPDYERWVLDSLAQNFAFKDPWSAVCGGSYHVHTFGATKEQYHGESWFPGYMGGQGSALFSEKAQSSSWRIDTPKKSTVGTNRYSELAERLRTERLLRKIALERKDFQSALLEQASKHRHAVEEMHRTGKHAVETASPAPQFNGVSAAYLLAMVGAGGTMM